MWVTQTKKRYVKVNNNYIKDQYNLDETSTYLQYLGKKNLYGWAVTQKLPIHEFTWQKVDDFTTEKIDKLLKKSQARVYFRSQCTVSKRAAQEA